MSERVGKSEALGMAGELGAVEVDMARRAGRRPLKFRR